MLPTKNNLQKRKEICHTLKSLLIQNLNLPYQVEDLRDDISIIGAGLGLDSLDILEVVLSIEGGFGVKVPELSVHILRSFNTIVDFIISQKEASCEV